MSELKFKTVNGVNIVELTDVLDGLTLDAGALDSLDTALTPGGNHIITVSAQVAFSPADKTNIINAVQNLGPIHYNTYVTNRLDEIDAHTGELIGEGYTYDVNQDENNQLLKHFSLSDNAQKNLNGIRGNFTGNVELAQEANSLTRSAAYSAVQAQVFPVKISTTDGYRHEFPTYAAFMGLHNGAFATVKTHYESGQDLREDILNEAYGDFDAVDAIVDTR